MYNPANLSNPSNSAVSFTLTPFSSYQVAQTLKNILPKCRGRSPDGFNIYHYSDSLHVVSNTITLILNSL